LPLAEAEAVHQHGVVPRPPGVGPRLAKAAHRRVHDGGVGRAHRLVAHSESGGRAGEKILDDHVGPAGQLEGDVLALRMLQVDGHPALVAVAGREDGAHPLAPAQPAHVVAAPRALHLDDVGAQIAQEHGRVGAGDDAREVENAQALHD
jgi:hypothetical protein